MSNVIYRIEKDSTVNKHMKEIKITTEIYYSGTKPHQIKEWDDVQYANQEVNKLPINEEAKHELLIMNRNMWSLAHTHPRIKKFKVIADFEIEIKEIIPKKIEPLKGQAGKGILDHLKTYLPKPNK